MLDPVTAWMGQWASIPSLYATNQPGQLSLLTLQDQQIKYWHAHLELKVGCVQLC